MSPTATCLLGLAAWSVFTTIMLLVPRIRATMAEGKALNSFDPAGNDLGDFGRRVTRAHANCYENLAVAAAVLLYAIATDQTAITNGLAMTFLGARVLQSVIHMFSTSVPAVLVRATLFFVQVFILIIWIYRLFHAA